MSHSCGHSHSVPSSVYQTLEELDFERGIWYAAQHNDIARVEKLLRQGVAPNEEDTSGYTALHYASRAGHLELCRILLAAGAAPNSLTRAGKASPLHRAASRGHVDIVKLLLRCGASPDLQDGDGKTALHRAVEDDHHSVVQALLDVSDISKNITDVKGHLPIDYAKDCSYECWTRLVTYPTSVLRPLLFLKVEYLDQEFLCANKSDDCKDACI